MCAMAVVAPLRTVALRAQPDGVAGGDSFARGQVETWDLTFVMAAFAGELAVGEGEAHMELLQGPGGIGDGLHIAQGMTRFAGQTRFLRVSASRDRGQFLRFAHDFAVAGRARGGLQALRGQRAIAASAAKSAKNHEKRSHVETHGGIVLHAMCHAMSTRALHRGTPVARRNRVMTIAALVLRLDPAAAPALTAELSADPSLSLGDPQVGPGGVLLPVVAESADATSGEALFEALRTRAGVQFVDVVMVDSSGAADQAAADQAAAEVG
jgi:hypothetical protein